MFLLEQGRNTKTKYARPIFNVSAICQFTITSISRRFALQRTTISAKKSCKELGNTGLELANICRFVC